MGSFPAGAELILDYEMHDSGNIQLEVSVPSIGSSFPSGQNFYSRQEGQIDFTKASHLIEEQSQRAAERLDEMSSKVDDERLDQARERLNRASTLRAGETDPEASKQAMDDVQEVESAPGADPEGTPEGDSRARARKDYGIFRRPHTTIRTPLGVLLVRQPGQNRPSID